MFVLLLNIMVKRKFSENWSTVPSKTMIGVRALKLHFQLYVSHWTNSNSHRKPLAGIVRSGSLIRVSQVVTSLIKAMFAQNYHRSLNAHTKLSQVVHVYIIKNYKGLYTSGSLWSSGTLILLVSLNVSTRQQQWYNNKGRQKLSEHLYVVVLLLVPLYLHQAKGTSMYKVTAERARA